MKKRLKRKNSKLLGGIRDKKGQKMKGKERMKTTRTI